MLIYIIEAPWIWPERHTPSYHKKFVYQLLWALSLATYLKWKKSNWQVEILDGQLINKKEIELKIKQNKPSIVGICPRFSNYKEVLEIARVAKKVKSKVIFGGVYASVLSKNILKNRGIKSKDYCVDVVIRGDDGEKALFEYINGDKLANINNLSYCDNRGIIRNNPIKCLDLDKLPIIDRELLNPEKYFSINKERYHNLFTKRVLFIYTQKGCSWQSKKGCSHCIRGMQIRTRSVDKVWEEINYLVKKYQTKYIINVSDATLDDPNWLKGFCEHGLRSKAKVYFTVRACPPRTNIDLKLVKLLKKIGVKKIIFYLGTLDEKISSNMNIGINKKLIENTLNKFQEEGMKFSLRIFLGGTGETKKSLNNCLGYLNKLALTKDKLLFVYANNFLPYPGSLAWHLLNEKTENKYMDIDLINYSEVFIDWINLFCEVSVNDIRKTRDNINKLGTKLFESRRFRRLE